MSDQHKNTIHNQGDSASTEFDWEQGLSKLRSQRHGAGRNETALTEIQRARQLQSVKTEVAPPSNREIEHATREKVLREYLMQWQQEHNEQLAAEKNENESVPTDVTVLLQEDWLNAQS